MARSIYIASPEGLTGKSTVALGMVDLFSRRVERVGVFRPIARADEERDSVLEMLLRHASVDLSHEECVGVTYDAVHTDPEAALATIVARYHEVESRCEVVVVVGSDYTDVAGPAELGYNARIAANLGAPVLLVVRALDRSPEDVRAVVDLSLAELAEEHATVVGVVANRSRAGSGADVVAALADAVPAAWAIPDVPLLSAPTVADLMRAVEGTLGWGDEALLGREVESVLVAGMNMEHILQRLEEGQLAITAADRTEVLLALVSAHAAEGFPSLAGVVLNGGFALPEQVQRLVEGLNLRLPVITTPHSTYETARRASSARGLLSRGSQRKIDVARDQFADHVDAETVMAALDLAASDVVTPLMFEHELLERARLHRKHIVLPEGTDDRVLRAAGTLLARGVADLTLLGEEQAVRRRAAELGVDLGGAAVVDPATSGLLEEFAEEYARLRAHRKVDLERARDVVRSVSYFGTMMVHLGHADGMVSGAQHTTADTIRPAFEIIGTRPGVSLVSSVFLMCLADRVLVYGDCAVNPDPTAEQLADIALSSARTAGVFGIEPRVAMLSYSTGESGAGADVAKVREATEIVRAELDGDGTPSVEGPIQYDAAVDASVASTKLPGSPVAGRATVFVFPDLNTGNNTYKAVQRSAGAVAIGPVLQGLSKPVNDLSRGALVQDIVNTVAITAIQAQEAAGGSADAPGAAPASEQKGSPA